MKGKTTYQYGMIRKILSDFSGVFYKDFWVSIGNIYTYEFDLEMK